MNTMKERLRLFFDMVAEGELACNFGEKDLLSFAEAEVHLATIAQSARIAELEGARAKAAEGSTSEWPEAEEVLCQLCVDETPVWAWNILQGEMLRRADVMSLQAAELERLRNLERRVRAAARDSSALDELDSRVLAALEEFDHTPTAQAEPQDCGEVASR